MGIAGKGDLKLQVNYRTLSEDDKHPDYFVKISVEMGSAGARHCLLREYPLLMDTAQW